MVEMIKARRHAEKAEERYDLFSSLLDAANEDDTEGEPKLTDRELMGNII
jgi:cytochrome P450